MTSSKSAQSRGFTLIELLIVIAILAILIIMSWISWRNQINKANDTDRKTDIERLQIAFEEYYSDNDRYPPSDILNTCQGNQLSPYLESVPCDPITNNPYCYVYDDPDFQDFRILAALENISDPIIAKLGCNGLSFCGWETECNQAATGDDQYTFGLSSTNVTIANPVMPNPSPSPSAFPSPSVSPSPSPSGIPSPPPHDPGPWACTPQGECDFYGINNPLCPIDYTFNDNSICSSFCPTSDPSQRCN